MGLTLAVLAVVAAGVVYHVRHLPTRTTSVTSSPHMLFYLLTALENAPEQKPFLDAGQVETWRGLLAHWVSQAKKEEVLLRGLVGEREEVFTPAQVAWITGHEESPSRKDLKRLAALLEKTAGVSFQDSDAEEGPLRVVGPHVGALRAEMILASILRMNEHADLALSPDQVRKLVPAVSRWLPIRSSMDAILDRLHASLTPAQQDLVEDLYRADANADNPSTASALEMAEHALFHGPLSPGGRSDTGNEGRESRPGPGAPPRTGPGR